MSTSVSQGDLNNAGLINTAIFLDAGYIGKFAKVKQKRISFRNIVSELTISSNHILTNYYNCMPIQGNPPTLKEQEMYANVQKFHSALKKIPNFYIKLGRLSKIWDPDCQKFEFNQKGVDM